MIIYLRRALDFAFQYYLIITLCACILLDGGGGRNSASGKENGNSHALEKSLAPTYVPTSQEEKSIAKGYRCELCYLFA